VPPESRTDANRQLARIDLDARGCGQPVVFDGRFLEVFGPHGQAQRFQVAGAPREAALLVGDWDCDGHEGIALYLPSSGETLRFDRLPEPGGEVRTVTASTHVIDGTATVLVDAAGCAEVEVVPP
jgi:hypothetical protein